MYDNLARKLDSEAVASAEKPLPMSAHLPRKAECDWPANHGESLVVKVFSFVLFGLSAALVEVALAQAVAFS